DVDGTAVGPAITPADTNYRPYTTGRFTVTAGYHTIRFVGLDPNGQDNTAFIDNVTVQLPPPGVNDGGFETPGLDLGAFQYRPDGTAWTFTGTSGVSRNGSDMTADNPYAPEGVQVAFLQADGTMSQ